MKSLRPGIGASLLILIILLACSSDDNPIAPKPPDNPVVLDTGGLAQIPGNATDTAAKNLEAIAAHPAPSDKIDGDGFMRTRLNGILNPTASVETVNNALVAASAVITFYDTATYSVSLRIPEQSSREDADSIGADLVETGAFWFLFAGQTAQVSGQGSISIIPQRPLWTIRHLRKMRMPAAWHVKELASRNSQQVRVIVPDEYASSNPIPEIPSQSFLSGNGTITVASTGPNGIVVGNHGFHVTGTIAASFDNSGSTGAHPGALQDISVLSLKIGGLGWNEIMGEISQSLPAMPCLVSTSLAYNQLISQRSKLQRAIDAISWRGMVASRQSNFLMFAAAGNNGQAPDDSKLSQYSLPWNLAATFASPNQMVPEVIPVGDRAYLDSYFQTITNVVPAAAFALNNVVIVGSSDTLGNLSLFSNTPSSVRAVGEAVCAPCLMDDPGLDTMKCRLMGGVTRALYDGTSMATPQVAGLAAYLWNIKPSLSLQELKTIIINAYNPLDPVMPGVIDAYRAVLSLDQSISDAPVRLALFDVAGSSGVAGSDNSFDEKDLALWFDEFRHRETARIGGADPFDYSRYDLNGNGISAIEAAYVNDLPQLFDLDVNSPPAFSTERIQTIEGQEIRYNETQATDLDIICYNAYSPLYTGDTERRTELCLPCLGEPVVHITLTNELQQLVPADVEFKVWRRTSATDSLPVRLADLDVTVEGAEPFGFTGVTDEQGKYVEQIIPSTSADNVTIRVDAKLNDVIVATDEVTVPVAGGVGVITFLSRQGGASAGAGKLFGSEPSCPPPTPGESITSDTEGPMMVGLSKSYVCPGTGEDGGVSANSSAGGSSDPGFTSGAGSATVTYFNNLSCSVVGRAGITMTATASHSFTVQFEISGGSLAFMVEAFGANSRAEDKLNTSLVKEGAGGGNVFVFDFPQGTPPQGMTGILEPGVYRFSANQNTSAAADGSVSHTANASVTLEIGSAGTLQRIAAGRAKEKLTADR